jgi:heterodisulfide reductase subunit A
MKEYGGGKIPDVIDGLQFERLLSASGPTFGEIKRPSDGKVPRSIAFIQCAGSRDPELYKSYCSKICCMYTAKHALLYKHKVPDGDAHVFYIDIRSPGKGYEEFVQNAIEHEDLLYYRGKVSNIYREGDKVIVRGADTLSGKEVEAAVDMVVIAVATIPAEGSRELMQKLKISVDKDGWLMEAHPKLRPVETNTSGIFLAGACQGPKDIPETVAQASAAATKVIQIMNKDELEGQVITALVDADKCRGCGRCEEACEFGAIKVVSVDVDAAAEGAGAKARLRSQVNEAICQGCGKCSTICCNKAITMRNFRTDQITDMIDAVL